MKRFTIPGFLAVSLSLSCAAPASAAGIAFVPRVGFLLTGSGEGDAQCDGDLCPKKGSGGDDDADDNSGPVLGLSILVPVGERLRLGADLLYATKTEFEPDEAPDFEAGSDLSALAAVEFSLSRLERANFFLHGAGGLVLLFPGEDLEDSLDRAKESCDTVNDGGGDCEVDDGPFVGFSVGGGGGLTYDFGGVKLRADLLLQWFTVPFAKSEVEVQGREAKSESSYSGTRLWLMAGLEFGG